MPGITAYNRDLMLTVFIGGILPDIIIYRSNPKVRTYEIAGKRSTPQEKQGNINNQPYPFFLLPSSLCCKISANKAS